jgi:sugar O-acyltransferase (sialic acid O-acetyltransferase NeuD family)
MRIAVIGAGGHSKEVVDLVRACGHEIAGFVDEALSGEHPTAHLAIVRRLDELDYDGVVIAIGDSSDRSRWFTSLAGSALLPTLVHPTAVVSVDARLGAGVQVMQHVVVNSSAVVGDDCILNVACSIAHDCHVGSHTHLAPGARLGGASSVGDSCLIGTNATIMPGVVVGDSCVAAAGAVVAAPVADRSMVAGVPARLVSAHGGAGVPSDD